MPASTKASDSVGARRHGLEPRPRAVPTATRRVPTQERSRRRVSEILDAAERLVVEHGLEALTTRDIAQAAGVPVASLYQYFGDKEEVLLALAERDMVEMDEQVALDVAALDHLSVASLVGASMRAFVDVYARRPAFVEIYLRGRTNQAVARFGRLHNARTAATLRELALAEGLCDDGLTPSIAELAVEVGDRCFQLAYEERIDGDPALVDEAIALLVSYLERHATPRGLQRTPGAR